MRRFVLTLYMLVLFLVAPGPAGGSSCLAQEADEESDSDVTAVAVALPPGFGIETIFLGPPLTNVSSLAASNDGNLFIGNYGSPAGVYRLTLATRGIQTLLQGLPIATPDRMTIGDGRPLVGEDLILADHNSARTSTCCAGKVFRVDRQTGSYSILSTANPLSTVGDPFGVALGPGAAWGTGLYIMDFEGTSSNPPVLFRVNPDGSREVFLQNASLWTLNRTPSDIAFAPGGSFGPMCLSG